MNGTLRTTISGNLIATLLLIAPSVAGAQGTAGTPTFSKDVAPIFYKNCTSCHRPGEVAPMSLLSYAAARPYARSIATRVSQGTMPPWHADPAHGEFVNDRTLTASEKDTILKWVSAGAPEGNAADLPPQPVYPDGWNIGKPDAVFALAEDYPVPASGTIDYKHFEVPTNLTEDRWIQAYEVQPGNARVGAPRDRLRAGPAAHAAACRGARRSRAPRRHRPRRRSGPSSSHRAWACLQRSARPWRSRKRPTTVRCPRPGSARSSAASRRARAIRVFTAGHGNAPACGRDAHLPDALHGHGHANDRSHADRVRLREGTAEAGSDDRRRS